MAGKKKKIIFSVILLIGLTLIGFLTLRIFLKAPPSKVSVPPSVQLSESRIIGRKEGVRQWEILTQSVLQAGDSVTLTNLDEIVMFQDQEPHLLIDANSAIWERKKDILHLYDSQVRDDPGEFYLESDLLIWRGEPETLTSPGPVFILWNGLEIRAQEMVMETAKNLLYLERDVQIRDGSMCWRMESAVYNLDDDYLDFFGNIQLEEKEQEYEYE